MGLQSLRDKLLQAGLVTQEQAKKAEADLEAKKRAAKDRREQPARGPGGGGGRGPQGGRPQGNRGGPQNHRGENRAAQHQAPKRELTEEEKRKREEEAAFREKERMLAREREENRKRALEDRKKLETLRNLCEKFEVTERGDEAFHFTSRKKKVMRLYLTPDQLAKLESGELAIIDKPLPGELTNALVTREAAEEAVKVDSKAVRFYNRGNGETFGFKAEAPLPGAEAPSETEAHEEPVVEPAPEAATDTAEASEG